MCEGPREVVDSTLAFNTRVRGPFPGLDGLKERKMFLLHPLVKLSIMESLHEREVACSTSDLQGLNFESCVCKVVSSGDLYVHKNSYIDPHWDKLNTGPPH